MRRPAWELQFGLKYRWKVSNTAINNNHIKTESCEENLDALFSHKETQKLIIRNVQENPLKNKKVWALKIQTGFENKHKKGHNDRKKPKNPLLYFVTLLFKFYLKKTEFKLLWDNSVI